MTFGQKIGLNNILDEFENGYNCLKNRAAKGRGIFPYMAIVKSCLHSRGHILYSQKSELGQKIHPDNILEELQK
jgi:hypothetical protein